MILEAGTRLGPYEIVSLLGKGGMGEVYRARDTRLDRDVALKVLRAEWSGDPRFKERLEREAKKISQLQHPNVCTLHDVGSEGEVDYLVMEYLHGETVESRLRRGPLPIPEVLRIGSQIAEAIEAAHRRGVVHRDLKPGNVILTAAAGAKVLDFGLARDATPPGQSLDTQAATFAAPITEEGLLVGTMPYMAPEQLEGRAADARADIWALGCVLYEMATGERPFRGATAASLTTAIMSAEPEPVSRKRSIAPERLDWIVKRCLAKDPERRWHSARDVSIELDAIAGTAAAASDSAPAVALPASASRRGLRRWKNEVSSPSRPRWLWAAAASIVLGVGIWWLTTRDREPEPLPAGAETAAALPFQTLSDDPEIRQLAAGIPQEMSAHWARSGNTLLTPSSSAGGSADPCAAVRGQRARVYHGSVGSIQSQVRVTAQLTACPEGNRLWGGTESYDATDLNAAQEKIAGWILSTSQGHLFLKGPEGTDTLAWEYLLRRTPADNQRGMELARESWRNDRTSQAGVTLTNLYMQALYEGWADSPSRTVEEMVDVARALAHGPRSGTAQVLFGLVSLLVGDRERALEAMERAVEIEGANPTSHAFLGLALALTDRPDEAIAAIDQAVHLSPDNPHRFVWEHYRAAAHFAAGRYQEACDAAHFALSFNTNDFGNTRANASQTLAASLAHLGELKEARSALEQAVRQRPALTLDVAGVWYAASGTEHRHRNLEGLRLAGLGEKGLVEVSADASDE